MIDARVVKFGYGTVVVGSYYTELTIQAIKPPQEVGGLLTEDTQVEYIGERIKFPMSKYYHELKEKLEAIQGPCSITFCGYIFDFTNYNRKSIDVILSHAQSAYRNYIRLIAC